MIKTIQKKTVNLQRVRTEQSVCSLRTVRWNRLARNRREEKKGWEHPNIVAWKLKPRRRKEQNKKREE